MVLSKPTRRAILKVLILEAPRRAAVQRFQKFSLSFILHIKMGRHFDKQQDEEGQRYLGIEALMIPGFHLLFHVKRHSGIPAIPIVNQQRKWREGQREDNFLNGAQSQIPRKVCQHSIAVMKCLYFYESSPLEGIRFLGKFPMSSNEDTALAEVRLFFKNLLLFYVRYLKKFRGHLKYTDPALSLCI